jgi:hypothetical protein
MVDKASGLSRGYGFVSYSALEEAEEAKFNMNGFKLGKKRLKVVSYIVFMFFFYQYPSNMVTFICIFILHK